MLPVIFLIVAALMSISVSKKSNVLRITRWNGMTVLDVKLDGALVSPCIQLGFHGADAFRVKATVLSRIGRKGNTRSFVEDIPKGSRHPLSWRFLNPVSAFPSHFGRVEDTILRVWGAYRSILIEVVINAIGRL